MGNQTYFDNGSATTVERSAVIDEIDRLIIKATQEGLPLISRPYDRIAELVGISVEETMQRMRVLLGSGVIRRIGAIPNHYKIGFKANAMTVWNVADAKVHELGRQVGALEYVSHCYQRPRHLPDWPYNLFAMVHGHDRAQAMKRVNGIAELLGANNSGHEILFSVRILKKSGLRIYK